MKLSCLLPIVLGLAVVAPAQKTKSAPVTCAEARSVSLRIQNAMAKALRRAPTTACSIKASQQPVTREQVLIELNRLSKVYRAAYTLKPRPQYFRPDAIHVKAAVKAIAASLVKAGFVEPVGGLVAGPGDVLSPDQFAEAYGFFVARWCDMTHQPTIKYSPSLMSDGVTPPQRAGSPVKVPSGAAQPRPSSSP